MRTVKQKDSGSRQRTVRKQSRYLRNLAESLAMIAKVPEGRHLIAVIGSGNERSNIEALVTWISAKEKTLRSLRNIGIDPLDYLYAEFLSEVSNG